jgi:hypothetical protein
MATLSITVPDAIVQRVLNGAAYYNGYQDQVQDGNGNLVPNPMTKVQFVKNIIKTYIKNCVTAYEATHAAEVARQAATDSAQADIQIGD